MKTKYDIGEDVLIKATVRKIEITEARIVYRLEINDDEWPFIDLTEDMLQASIAQEGKDAGTN